eukprot:scaffold152298_cov29-Tisochrysis_lutea.AAC.3
MSSSPLCVVRSLHPLFPRDFVCFMLSSSSILPHSHHSFRLFVKEEKEKTRKSRSLTTPHMPCCSLPHGGSLPLDNSMIRVLEQNL